MIVSKLLYSISKAMIITVILKRLFFFVIVILSCLCILEKISIMNLSNFLDLLVEG